MVQKVQFDNSMIEILYKCRLQKSDVHMSNVRTYLFTGEHCWQNIFRNEGCLFGMLVSKVICLKLRLDILAFEHLFEETKVCHDADFCLEFAFRSRSFFGTVFKLLGVATVGAGGVVGYAWYDPSFRKTLEDNVPYSKEALAAIFVYLPESAQPAQQPV